MNMKNCCSLSFAIAACSAATASPPSDKSLNRWMEVQHIERDFLKNLTEHDGSTKPTTHATGPSPHIHRNFSRNYKLRQTVI